MLWDKAVARILLVLSIANVALAAPAIRERHLDMAASEKRAGLDDEGSEPMPALVSDSDSDGSGSLASRFVSGSSEGTDFESDRYFLAPESLDNSPPGSPSGSSHHDSASELPSDSSHQDFVSASSTLSHQD